MIKNLLLQAIVFIAIFMFISWIRETDMLATDTKIEQSYVLSDLHGQQINLATGDKPAVFYFFAPWCEICHLSIGNLQSVYEKNENLDVYAIALDFTSQQEVEKFTARHQLTFPVLLGNESVKQDFKISGYPSYYVVDEGNKVTSKALGYSTELGIYLRSL
ncbi:TlpA family protein disulfide reductase [Thalassotalea euphylliae]|uniref:TlpA family protein disulfide reductase n=1 Tax=Thalassotalea euphylliae TaxID=1655234 RepID=UPI003637F313